MLMVQSNIQLQMKSGKLKGPPPVPPRPNQSVVAEALAKTRRAVAESKAKKPKAEQRSKTLDRLSSTQASSPPKQNGLARVKSFIRDVMSDRGSEEKKPENSPKKCETSPQNSLKSISNIQNPKTSKSCKQILIRSLSTSNKLEDNKCKISKSASFAEKTLPLRKAPPPPLSPKPKLKQIKPVQIPKRNLNDKHCPSRIRPPSKTASYASSSGSNRNSFASEAPYATVDEIKDTVINRLSLDLSKSTDAFKLPTEENNNLENTRSNEMLSNEQIGINKLTPGEENANNTGKINDFDNESSKPVEENNKNSTLERKTSKVTEQLISEILASKNEANKISCLNDNGDYSLDNCSHHLDGLTPSEGESRLKDMNNHEMLIYELQTMRSQTQIPDVTPFDTPPDSPGTEKFSSGKSSPISNFNSEYSESSDYADPYAYIVDGNLKSRLQKQFKAISNMSLQGLPPLPKSLSGFADISPLDDEAKSTPTTPDSENIKPTDMDSQLALLKKEMASLRQLDLSLLSELWSLSEAMAAWRRQLERSRLRPAPPPPPPPAPASYLRT